MYCQKDEITNKKNAVAKSNKEVPSDSLQNPSDPDAGYCGHKGKGYQAQVVENYVETSDSDEKKKQLSLITHISTESADKHDANALLPIIEDLKERAVGPKELLADSLYGSSSNCDVAKRKHGVEVVAPLMSGGRKYTDLSKFNLDKRGRITVCPQGVLPKSINETKNGFSVAFSLEACEQCENLDTCPVKKGKKVIIIAIKTTTSPLLLAGNMKKALPLKTDIVIGQESKPPCRSSTDEPELRTFRLRG